MSTAVAEKPPVSSKYESQVEAELGKAANRVRLNDALTGAVSLVILALGYAVAGILLDRWLDLPEFARQLGLLGFFLAFLGLGYALIVRPYRRAVNPRFVARQVEETIPDAKNALINWVDLKEHELPTPIRTSVSSRAANGLAEADVSSAVDSRKLVWLGATAGLLLAVLAGLFVVCKPAQFFSLLGRTFTPFTRTQIANRTQITLTDPADGNVTITTGESLTFAVSVGGSVPDSDAPNRLRLQFRHTETGEYDELPLEAGATNYEWSLRVPPHVLQNGMWYRIAGGDASTPEYRVTVRSRPMFRTFQTEFVYPKYTRIPPETGKEPRIEGLQGTEVTLTTLTNRTNLKSGRLSIAGQPSIPGEVVGPNRDTLKFRFPIRETGSYRLSFVTDTGEASDPTPAYPIKAIPDEPPLVTITGPTSPEITLPANGLLNVEGNVADDYGVARVELKMQILGEKPGSKAIELQPKLYLGAESLQRKSDGSFPRNLGGGNPDEPGYRESIRLAELKTKDGTPVQAKEGMQLEFWLEATDNCEPKANVGSSGIPRKRLRLTPPEVAPPAEDPKTRAHQAAQKNRLNNENRPAPAGHNQNPAGNPPEGPQNPPEGAKNPPEGTNPGDSTKQPDPAQNPIEKTAEQANQAINQQQNNPGAGKNGDNAEAKPEEDPAAGKHAKPDPQSGGAAEPKPGEDPNAKPNPEDPMKGGASSTKPEGKVEPPPAPAEPKEQPGAGEPGSQPKPGSEPQGDTPKNPPKEGNESGSEKPGDSGSNPMSKPDQAGGESKPQDPKDPKGGTGSESQPQPGSTKPQTQPERGTGNETPKPQPGEQPKPEERPGDTKGQKPTPGGETKSQPKGGDSQPESKPSPGGEANDPTKPEQNPSASKPEGSQANSGNSTAKGSEKSSQPQSGGCGGKPDSKDIEKAVEDLNSPNPDKREAARQTLEKAGGKDAVQRGEQAARDMKSPDQLTREQGERDRGELSRELGRDGQPEPDKGDVDRLTRNAEELASENPQTRQRAEKEFEDKLRKKDRDDLKKAANDLKSGDPGKQKAAKEKVDELSKKAAQNAKANANQKQDRDLAKKAEDLASGDASKQDAAKKEFADKLGKQDQSDLEQAAKDLKSGNADQQQAAKDKIQELSKKAGQAAREKDQQTKAAAGDLAKKAEDLASGDPSKKEAAQKEFADKLDPKDQKDLEQAAKDLNSKDPEKQKASKEKLDELSQKAAKNAQAKQDADLAKKSGDLAKKAEDLASSDPSKKEAAQKEFANKLDPKDQKDLNQAAKDLNSKDPKQQQAAKDKIDDLSKKAAQNAKAQKEAEELAKKAADLASKDEAKRKAAEKEFDEKLGKDKREQLQKSMEDLASGDPKRAEKAMKDLQDMAKGKVPDREGEGDDPEKEWKPGSGAFKGPDGKPWEDNPKNRLKAGQLQLEKFEKNRYNTELHKKLGMTEEDYAKFLDGYREMVARQKEVVDNLASDKPLPTGVAPIRVSEGTGSNKLENRSDGLNTTVGSTNATEAPPGFSDAQKRFAEEAARLRRGNK